MAGEGNEEMAMGGVTVGNRTGMVGTVAESQAADARFKGEEMAMGGVMVGESVVDVDVQFRVGMEGVARDTNASDNVSAVGRLCRVLNLSRG